MGLKPSICIRLLNAGQLCLHLFSQIIVVFGIFVVIGMVVQALRNILSRHLSILEKKQEAAEHVRFLSVLDDCLRL